MTIHHFIFWFSGYVGVLLDSHFLSCFRGCAHVGLIKSMQEAGIPIDIVGGTSIGSIIGAIWAEETNITRCTQRSREWSMV